MEPMENIRVVLAARMKARRKTLKMNQEDLAEASQLSIGMIKNVELGSRWPSPETFEAIANGLQTTVGELLNEETQQAEVSPHAALKMFLKIPEDIIKRAQDHELNGKVWEYVRIAFDEVEAAQIQKHKAKKNHG